MKRYKIIIENPKYMGNVGMICRLIANFGMEPLRVIGEKMDSQMEMEWMAHNSVEEIHRIQYFSTVTEAIQDVSIVLGTGMIKGRNRGPFLKTTQISSFLSEKPGDIGILFGREDTGLSSSAISYCHYMIDFELPGSQTSMNLSHSVSFMLSLLFNYPPQNFQAKQPDATVQKSKLYEYASTIFEILGMDQFHGKENLALKRLKSILDSRPLTSGDIGFLHKVFQKIERVVKKK
jgi:TrmH family RNA methyltransferase